MHWNKGTPMEDPATLRMNLDHFRRLLKTEADPAKRQMILRLIRETEAKLRPDQYSCEAPSHSGFNTGLPK
jgi:hypothetical protein